MFTRNTGSLTTGRLYPSATRVLGFSLTLDPYSDTEEQVEAQADALYDAGWVTGEGIVSGNDSFISVLHRNGEPMEIN